ncbi:helix-turn-helix domain-containing protein [Sinomicrobium weinanense]|uniref:Helix-turn-helix domain-containing protein n=1 Tax=Sinomicrobium weinanense TaxID=2842200 RepID=A0A926Q480_9FLAO|nr:helix-turn-helix domain-containing protein [Sinomicrobium weinanense]MBU3125517.1 helix-turn-helix transcriptional regulator [Sinomicrobium weinanense]
MDYNKAIYSYIEKAWKNSGLSKRKFATEYNIEERTLRDILKKDSSYQISLPTIYKICEARNIKVSEFFANIEKVISEN